MQIPTMEQDTVVFESLIHLNIVVPKHHVKALPTDARIISFDVRSKPIRFRRVNFGEVHLLDAGALYRITEFHRGGTFPPLF